MLKNDNDESVNSISFGNGIEIFGISLYEDDDNSIREADITPRSKKYKI